MAFVRRKRVGPYEYHQLVENQWIDGKPRQRVLLHLGRYTSVEAALEGWPSAAQRPKARETLESREDRWQDFARPCTIFTATPVGRDWFRTLETRSAKTGDLSRSGHDTDRAYVRARPGGRSRRRELGWGRKNIPGWAGGPQGGSFRPPDLEVQAWALVDMESGLYLAGENPDEPLPTASTANVMMALVALEEGMDLDEEVTVSEEAE